MVSCPHFTVLPHLALIFERCLVHSQTFLSGKNIAYFSATSKLHFLNQLFTSSYRNLRFLPLRRCGPLWAAGQAHPWWSLLRMGFRGYWSQTTPSLWSPPLSITSLGETVIWHRWEESSTVKATASALLLVRVMTREYIWGQSNKKLCVVMCCFLKYVGEKLLFRQQGSTKGCFF